MQFTLVVGDFGVKYVGEEHAQLLKYTLEHHYKLTCDWTGTQYIGITLDWDYNKRQVHLSMPNYVKKALKQFQRIAGKLQHLPYPSVPIQYGAKKQYATQESTAPLLDDKAKCFIQQVCGKFLFLGRAVDSTLLCPISTIASQSSKPTTDMIQQTLQLLDYLATQEDAVLSYHASDMVLAVEKNSFAAAASASAAAAAAAAATAVVVFVDSGVIIVIAVDCHRPRRRRCCRFCCHRRCSLL